MAGMKEYLDSVSEQWDQALASFRGAAELNTQDRLPQIYIGRCEELKATPPPDDWNGVWVLKIK